MHTSLGLRIGSVVGAVSLATLAASPALAADPVSQATAQSLQLSIAGNTGVSQIVTATYDGTSQTKSDASTIPTIAGVLPGNNALGAGVAPQDAGANANGTSYACAGIAGTGGGIVHTGNTSCNIDGAPITLNLGSLNLGTVTLDPTSALGAALKPLTGTLLDPLIQQLQQALLAPLTSALSSSPLGSVRLGGTLSALEATCAATPARATGAAHLVDTRGGSATTPITATIGGQTVTLVDLPANPPANTHLLVNLDTVTQSLIDAVTVQLNNTLAGPTTGSPLAALATALGTGLQTLQDDLVTQLVKQLQPALQPLQQNVLDVTLNKQVVSDGGRKIDVTALDLQVLPAASAFTGSSLISGQLGEVTCGPNAGDETATPQGNANPVPNSNNANTANPATGANVPTAVDAGLAGDSGGHRLPLMLGLGGLVATYAAGATYLFRRFRS